LLKTGGAGGVWAAPAFLALLPVHSLLYMES
jgi:hypothetical protein